jgi:hypothetical protein
MVCQPFQHAQFGISLSKYWNERSEALRRRPKRSSISAEAAGALFDALLIICVVLLVLGFTVYRPD